MKPIISRNELLAIVATVLLVNGIIQLWMIWAQDAVYVRAPYGNIKALASLPAEGLLIAGYGEGQLSLFKTRNGELIRNLVAHESPLICLSAIQATSDVVTAAQDGSVCVWTMPAGKLRLRWVAHKHGLTDARVTADGLGVVTANGTRKVRLWKLSDGTLKTEFDLPKEVMFAGLDASRHVLAVAANDRRIELWKLTQGKPQTSVSLNGKQVGKFVFGSTTCTIAVVNSSGTITIFDAQTGKQRQRLAGQNYTVHAMELFADDHRLISGASDGTVCVWDIDSGAQLRRFESRRLHVGSVAFIDDGKVASGGMDNTIILWDCNLPMLP